MALVINVLARTLVTRTAKGPGLITRAVRVVRPSGREPVAGQSASAVRRPDLPRALDRLPSVSRGRKVRSMTAEGLVYVCLAIAVFPLGMILGYILAKGIPAISWGFLTTVPSADPFSTHTGISAPLVGTLIMLGLATMFAAPLGLLTALFISEARGSRSRPLRAAANGMGFLADVLLGVPSIVVGVTVFLGVVVLMGSYSALAGGLALAFIMFPIIVRTADEILRLVPGAMKEAALGLGAPRWRVAWSVILPAAAPGLLTGVVLAVARAAGETAPLLFTALGNQSFSTSLLQPIASLPKLIFDNTILTRTPQTEQAAWGAALVLVAIILLLNLVARAVARKTRTLEAR
jgi:phosphate transport system permease protein